MDKAALALMCGGCEARQYLLDELTAIPLTAPPEVSARLSPKQRRLIGAMLQRPGEPLTRPALIAACMAENPAEDWPQPDVVKQMVCQVRRKRLPVEIRTWPGLGYSATLA